MRRDTEDELQRLSEALLMEQDEPEAPEEAPWDEPEIEDILPIEDVTEYKNHANNYGKAFNSDRTEVSAEELSDALLEENTPQKGNGGLLLAVILLLLAIVSLAVYWMVLR